MIDINENSIVACICEGTSERAILELLLEENELIFNEGHLFNNEISHRYYRNVEKFTNECLTMDFEDSDLLVLIVQDNADNYNIKRPYLEKVDALYYVITKPELEMLMIHSLNLYEEYQKVKSHTKPSDFLADRLKTKKKELKSTIYIREFFSKYSLRKAITEHKSKSKRMKAKNQYFLCDLLN